jgi:hypothetical protein
MPQFGVVKAAKLLMVLRLWPLPILAPTPAKLPAGAAGIVGSAIQEQKAVAASNASEYAGAESCKTCHEDTYNGWEKGPHWKQTYTEGGIAKHGCEDCHAAAASHVADPTDTSKLFPFEKASAKEINARCLGCHAGGTQHMTTK